MDFVFPFDLLTKLFCVFIEKGKHYDRRALSAFSLLVIT